jgi:hypothetical protein
MATATQVLDLKHRDEMIAASGIYSADGDEIKKVLRWRLKGISLGRGTVIPYFFNGESEPNFRRVKLDYPYEREVDGNKPKYESPKGWPNRAYFPPGFWEANKDPRAPIAVTEGEKKGSSGKNGARLSLL